MKAGADSVVEAAELNPDVPAMKFDISSDQCNGLNMLSGAGIYYDEDKISTKCKDIAVDVTFTWMNGTSAPVDFRSACDSKSNFSRMTVKDGDEVRQIGYFMFKIDDV